MAEEAGRTRGGANAVRDREVAAGHLREFIRALIRARKSGTTAPPDALLADLDLLTAADRGILYAHGTAVLERLDGRAAELQGGAWPRVPPPLGAEPAAEPAPIAEPGPGAAARRPPRPPARAGADPTAVGSVLQALVAKCLEMLAGDLCQVFLVEEHTLALRAEAPNEPSTITGPSSLPLSGGFAARVLEASCPLRLGEVDDLQGAERIWLDRGMWSIAAVALGGEGEPGNGILVAARNHARPFTDDELAILDQLSDEVGLALASADLVSRAEELAVLKERIKLAREIHDGLASDLSAVVALFKYHEHRRQVDPDDAEQLLVQMRTLVEGSLQSARDILATLRPRPQNIKRLGEVLRHHVEEFGRTYGVSAIFTMMGDDHALAEEERDTLYQVLREALTNIRKHADASTVDVTIDLRGRPYVLVVEDDGVGIDLAVLGEKPGSFGIMGMKERAELLGGSLEVGPSPQGGTRLMLRGGTAPMAGA